MSQLGRFILVLAILFILAGCWNRVELNELWVTAATGVDMMDDGQWMMSYQIIVPSAIASGTGGGSGGTSQPASHVLSVKSKTYNQALSYSNLETSRRIYIAHNRVIYIGKRAAEQGMDRLIDFYLRNTEAREMVSLIVTDGLASDLLKKLLPPEKLQGAAMAELVDKESDILSLFPKVRVYDFVLSMNSESKSIGVPVAELIGERDHQNEQEAESLNVFKKTSAPLKLALTKLAVFQKGKLKGFLNKEESLGVSYLSQKINNTEISFPCSEQPSREMYSSILVNSANVKLTPRKTSSHYTMQVGVKINGTLNETTCTKDISKTKTIHDLEEEIAKEVTSTINKGWAKLQELGVDATGFADRIHRRFPREWETVKKDWDQEFKKIELDIRVDARIQRPGLLQKHIGSQT
ncbi:Ger(x)C family spore germination protein [Paenibacillus polymyxa]|uniref:Ger(x)C family spore germination protein n=1 Tax=Paenibacillus polymyxa TaxID=1406 RepID=UPI0004D8228A|nr:Ger(x)C family spore germination protein [Paenibacillus polymyxa]KEO79519.1 spore gernimation protein GerC [Paenibacillus polymyxa]MCH6187523.1 Ger(x)C family spore germination protein [Paenibacillus polymyxa]MDY8095182.1 Ger(x)C family spore germination protein [Paenibacillus polymyxa]WRL59296.1 Ger(x)C family spore germination protein [Paenibacillus polymyxa]